MGKLDDLKFIRKIDESGMLRLLIDFHLQVEDAQKIAENLSFSSYSEYKNVGRILISGMGGSAIGGDLVRALMASKCPLPVYVNRSYQLPAFVGKETLFFAISYSGNTEETFESFKEAKSKSAKVIAITSGGQLQAACSEASIPCVSIPSGYPPRCALGYLFVPILTSLSKLGLANGEDIRRQLSESATLLAKAADEFKPQSDERSMPKSLAYKLHGSLPIIYASSDLEAVALRWKSQFCENAKSMAYSYAFPEMNHNEIEGWHFPEKVAKQSVVIFLTDPKDHPKVKARMQISRKLIAENVKDVIQIEAKGESDLAKILYLIYIGDFTSYYMAILNETDPTPVNRITQLKNELERCKS